MGYGYTINAHPRVDSFTEKLAFRRKAWIELCGCVLFALPYVALVAYHTMDFVATSYAVAEQSESPFGLTHRWIIKGIYAAGVWLVVLGHPQRPGSRDRLPVRGTVGGGGQSADRQHRHWKSSPHEEAACSTGWPTTWP